MESDIGNQSTWLQKLVKRTCHFWCQDVTNLFNKFEKYAISFFFFLPQYFDRLLKNILNILTDSDRLFLFCFCFPPVKEF